LFILTRTDGVEIKPYLCSIEPPPAPPPSPVPGRFSHVTSNFSASSTVQKCSPTHAVLRSLAECLASIYSICALGSNEASGGLFSDLSLSCLANLVPTRRLRSYLWRSQHNSKL